MYCRTCGRQLSEDELFCSKCGTKTSGEIDTKVSVKETPQLQPKWETISITVDNSSDSSIWGFWSDYYCKDINALMKDYALFGWELFSNQRMKTRSSHLEGRADGVYSVTETTDESSLTFRRNMNMPHYSELDELFQRYKQVMENWPVFHSTRSNFILILLILVFWPLAIVYFKKYDNADWGTYHEKKNKAKAELAEIMEKVKQY